MELRNFLSVEGRDINEVVEEIISKIKDSADTGFAGFASMTNLRALFCRYISI